MKQSACWHSRIHLFFCLSVQKGRVSSSSSPQLYTTSPSVGEKDKVLRRVWMWLQLPKLHPHLSHWVHHVLHYQRLWVHRNQLPARQGECNFGFKSECNMFVVCPASFMSSVSLGVCGWWSGSLSGEWMGARLWEVHLHRAAGQRHVSPCCTVQTACLWPGLSSGEIHRDTKDAYLACASKVIHSYIYLICISGLNIHFIRRRVLWKVHTNQLCGVRGRDARGHTYQWKA